MGLHGFSFGDLIFENCFVPTKNLLGAEGDGLAVAYSSSILYGRPNLTAVSLGIHQAIVEHTVRFTQTHQRCGKHQTKAGPDAVPADDRKTYRIPCRVPTR